MSTPHLPPLAIEYPQSDGKPMAENDAQRNAILYGRGALGLRYRERPDVYVSGDLLIYYEEGDPRVSVVPDVFVVFGVEDRLRGNYKVWEEGKGPDFVLEVASPSTWREDVRRKPGVYAGLGVREYFLYDPTGDHYTPRVQGYRLVDGRYERLTAVESIDRTLALSSEVLGLELRATAGGEMRFHDPATVEDLLSHDEACAAHREPSSAPNARRPRGEPPRHGSRSSRHAWAKAAANRGSSPEEGEHLA